MVVEAVGLLRDAVAFAEGLCIGVKTAGVEQREVVIAGLRGAVFVGNMPLVGIDEHIVEGIQCSDDFGMGKID